jgi:hypothetical protein
MTKTGDYARTLEPEVGAEMMKICSGQLQHILTKDALSISQMDSLVEELKAKEPRVDWNEAIVHLTDSILGIE